MRPVDDIESLVYTLAYPNPSQGYPYPYPYP